MRRMVLLMMVALLLAFAATAAADVRVVCPSSVSAGSPLSVTVTAFNYDCNGPVTYKRAMVTLVGNNGGAAPEGGVMGYLGIWGPYHMAIKPIWTIPAATCDGDYTPGTAGSKTIQVISEVPVSLAGTVAMVNFMVTKSNGEVQDQTECVVPVTGGPQ